MLNESTGARTDREWVLFVNAAAPRAWLYMISPPVSGTNRIIKRIPSPWMLRNLERARTSRMFGWLSRPLTATVQAWSLFRIGGIFLATTGLKQPPILLTNDDARVLSYVVPFLPRHLRVLVLWWNEKSEALSALERWPDRLKRRRLIHRFTLNWQETSDPLPRDLIHAPLFALLPPADIDYTVRQNQIAVFVGNADTNWICPCGASSARGSLAELIQEAARTLVEADFGSWRTRGEDLVTGWATQVACPRCGTEVMTAQVLENLGNRVRQELVRRLAASRVGHHLVVAGPGWGKSLGPHTPARLVGPLSSHQARACYRSSRVSLDLGSRSLLSPSACYERTSQIVTSGPGLLRVMDVSGNELLRGVEERRGVSSLDELVFCLERMLRDPDEVFFQDASAIRENYVRLWERDWAEMSESTASWPDSAR